MTQLLPRQRRNTVLKETCASTIEYLCLKSKTERKKIGQFFTAQAAARFMGSLLDTGTKEVRIADPGTGTGILAAAVLNHIFESKQVRHVVLDLFENDENVLHVLEQNIEAWKRIADSRGVCLTVTLVKDNFITHNQSNWANDFHQGKYDFIISNPPYRKLQKSAVEAKIMEDIVYGQPNMYFLFMAMACKLLKDDGEMVFIIPRSWTSGLYFKEFREYFLSNMCIERIHQFVSRRRVFEHENVLQETIIVKSKKTQKRLEEILISSSNSINDFADQYVLSIPYNTCVKEKGDRFVYLPTSEEEVDILLAMESFGNTLADLGFRMRTGPTVDFRMAEAIHDKPEEDDFPLLWPQNISSGKIQFPVLNLPGQYISGERKPLLIENGNYLFVKRFSSKEEKRRLQPAILLAGLFSDYKMFSAENHLNYITKGNSGLGRDEAYGLFVIFNSTLWDRYYRILNGSTQVNATECNHLPLPGLQTIRKLGKCIQMKKDHSTESCDELIMEELVGYRRRKNNFVQIGHAEKTAV
jgi:adenine-specific DNA-methyltransferase